MELKISEALLFIARESGGFGPNQPNEWIGKLIESGYMQIEYRKHGDGLRVVFAATKKGEELVKHIKLRK